MKTNFLHLRWVSLIAILLLSSCAVYKKDFHPEYQNWTHTAIDDDKIMHRLFLIGDAGAYDEVQTMSVTTALKKRLDEAGKKSSVIFLGDNIYPAGYPSKKEDLEGHEMAKASMDIQIKAVKKFKGKTVFIAGNHDWYSGLKGLKRQQDYIEKKLDSKKIFQPEAGCGGPDVIELSDDITLIAIDSYWYKLNWDKEPEINEGCPYKTRSAFLNAFESALKKNTKKTVIVALHHPPMTSGPHGGRFGAKDHLFSFSPINDKLLIPLPFAYTFLRRNIGITEDNSNPKLRELHEALRLRTRKYSNVFYVSGHEHNLQYAEVDHEKFIVSGSGSKRTPAKAGGPFQFTYSKGGFVEMVFTKNGEIHMDYHALTQEDSPEMEVVFSKTFEAQNPIQKDYDFSIYENKVPTVNTSIYEGKLKTGPVHDLMWGNLHRSLYYEKADYPTMDLDEHLGGLKVVRKGGGMQTNSLRLEAEDGRQYVMKSLRKDVSRLFFGTFANSFAQGVMEDFYTWTHPFAINMLKPLEAAANIYHTNPKLYFIPKQPALGIYNEDFGGEIYLFEERPAGDRRDVDSFGNSKDIHSTFDLIDERLEEYNQRIDTDWLIRSRLFDLLVGDFDRHFDQWRWAEVKGEDGKKVHRPIPRDRDQAFINLDGPMPSLVKMVAPAFRTFQSYSEYPQNIRWLEFNAYGFDRFFLKEPNWQDWEKQIKFLQANISDEVIEASVAALPDFAQKEKGQNYVELMKKRRANLPKIAREIYLLINKTLEIPATEKDDRIFITIDEEGNTHVLIEQDRKEGKKQRVKYERTIPKEESDLIVIYGLDGKDEFTVTGPKADNKKIILVGGTDKDTYNIDQKGRKAVKIIDDKTKNELNIVEGGKDRRTKIKYRNTYDFMEKPYPLSIFTPSFVFNQDDKFSFGFNYSLSLPKFKRQPSGQKHTIKTLYSPANQGGIIEYEANFYQLFGKWDLGFDALFQTPRYAINFFGLGNEIPAIADDVENEFNQVRLERKSFGLFLNRPISDGFHFQWTGSYDAWDPEQTEDRFIDQDPVILGIDPDELGERSYLNLGAKLTYNNQDHPVFPTIGTDFGVSTGWTNRLDNSGDFLTFHAHMAFYQNLNRAKTIVWASKIQYDKIGDGYSFYQSASLGGNQSLRAFRRDRFRGDAAFSVQNDIRINFGKIKSKLFPARMGITGGFDLGRVWIDEQDSDTWHPSYGGSLFFELFGLAGLNLGYHTDGDEGQVLFGLGFDF